MSHYFVRLFFLFLTGGCFFTATAQWSHQVTGNKLTFLHEDSALAPIGFELSPDWFSCSVEKVSAKYSMASFHFKTKTLLRSKTCQIDNIEERGDTLRLTGQCLAKDWVAPFEVRFWPGTKQQLEVQIMVYHPEVNQINFSWSNLPGERFFGLGEQPTHLEMTGLKPVVFCEEQGIGRGDQPITFFANMAGAGGNKFTSYAPIPFWVSNHGRAMLIHEQAWMQFDFSQKENSRISIRSNRFNASFWSASSPSEALELYTAVTGRMPKLPDWAYGTWLGIQGGKERVEKILQEAVAAGNPVSAFWIQDWCGRRQTRFGSQLWWRWQPDSTAYPDFKNWCASLNDQNIRVLGYVNSFLATEGPQYETAVKEHFLVKNKTGAPYIITTPGFPAVLVDLSNPEAFAWLKNLIIENLIGNGLSGWMADYGEWLPPDAVLYSGADPILFHNQYPVEWARLNREAVREAGLEGEVVFFSRAGFTGINEHSTLFWAGDQMVNWKRNDGMPSALLSVLSSGLSGITLNHSDIGGYTTFAKGPFRVVRSKRLLHRWIEWEAFTPLFRTHEGVVPKANHQVYSNRETVDFFARFGRLNKSLEPYFKAWVAEAARSGQPVVRPLWWHFPEEGEAWNYPYTFLTGSDLLVMPVLSKHKKSAKGYLPSGQWIHGFSGEIWEGGKSIKVKAPLGQPAVFIQKGSVWENELRNAFLRIAPAN